VEGVSVLVVREIGKERLQVFFVKKDPLPSIPSGDDMIQCSPEMDPRLTGHRELFIKEGCLCQYRITEA